eukprot:2584986-Amphidinium_carterae.1
MFCTDSVHKPSTIAHYYTDNATMHWLKPHGLKRPMCDNEKDSGRCTLDTIGVGIRVAICHGSRAAVDNERDHRVRARH